MACAQELRCTVTVNADLIEGSSKELFTSLQTALTDVMNNTKWTGLTIAESERIECSLMLIVSSVNDEGIVSCDMTLQSRRPVWGTSYQTPLLNLKDQNFKFSYQLGDRIEYNPSTYTTNLAALTAFYAYLIIGTDMDSYERNGGTSYFQVCENIVTQAQSATAGKESESKGWGLGRTHETARSRFTLISNLMDEAFKPYRNFFYEYHRIGLDQMQANVDNARAGIADGIQVLKQCYQARANAIIISVFTDTKCDELVSLFSQGTTTEKKQVYDLLVAIDPTRSNTYDAINQ